MSELLSLQDMVDGHLDVKSLGVAANGDAFTDVTTRTGRTYPTVDKTVRLFMEHPLLGTTPYATKALLDASSLANGSYAFVIDDTKVGNNGVWQKVSGVWKYLQWNYKELDKLMVESDIKIPMSKMMMFGSTTVTAPSTAIKNLGFTEMASGNNNRPFVAIWSDVSITNHYFARVYVQTDVANSFGSPYIYWWDKETLISKNPLLLERKISDNIAVYYLSAQAVVDNINKVLIGVDAAPTGTNMKIFGVQFATSNNPILDIKQTSYGITQSSIAEIYHAINNKPIPDLQRPSAKYNTKIVYGQSLAAGQESWPSLSRINNFGNLMLGNNVRPSQSDGNTYPTFGDAILKPLFANVVNGVDGLVTDANVANLSPGDAAYGEPINHGFANASKHYLNQKLLTDNDSTRLFVTINPAVSGRTIEQLSKTNTQDSVNRYGRFIDGLTKVEAATSSDTHVVDAIAWLQGEWNYGNNGGSWDKSTYKTLFNQLINDMQSDTKAITAQTSKPAILTYQTGAGYTRNVDSAGNAGLHIGMAQLETANTRDDTFMFGPTYPYTDKGGHLDSNGYRWMGNKIAQVYKHVVLDGKNWSPLQPIKITQDNKIIRVDFYVPVPPLNFASTYVVNTATMYPAKGFKVTDADGDIAIINVEVFDTHVEILTQRKAGVNAHVWYASADTLGNGNLRDSDNTVAYDKYEYLQNSGMYASANIAALVNKPYPLQNWCVAFYLPVNYTYALA